MNKRNKRRLRLTLEIIICSFIIVSIFGLRNLYGNLFLKKDQQVVTETQGQTAIENKKEQTESSKKVVKEKITPEQINAAIGNVVEGYETQYSKISVVYNNLKTGHRYTLNSDEYFTAASTTKVVYGLYVYDRIAKGQLSEDDMVDYNNNMLEAGGGYITNQPKKKQYPLDEVIMNMITYSDNTATNMILVNRNNTIQVLQHYMEKLGMTISEEKAKVNQVTPAMMESIWLYLYNNKENYPRLLEFLKDSQDHENIKTGISNKIIASKYGAIDNKFHDTAIVFGEEDYILLVYTENVPDSESVIADIAYEINKIHDSNIRSA